MEQLLKTMAVEFLSGCCGYAVSPHGAKMESISDPALEETEEVGTWRSLLYAEMLLYLPGHR